MFSPYYAFARARGRADPENHVAMNVALYGTPHRWAMTERGRRDLARTAREIEIGPSAMRWFGDELHIEIDETTAPLPSRLRGRITVKPRGLATRRFALDAAGRHRWQPIAPLSDVTVAFEAPALRWTGTGYFDTNDGDEPLEAAFRSWTWSRFDLGDGARIFYDVIERDGAERGLSLDVRGAQIVEAPALPYQRLTMTGWRIPRAAPCESGGTPALLQTMENAPFYARSAVRARIDGADRDGVHETLSLSRLVNPAVRFMLPFKMPRWAR